MSVNDVYQGGDNMERHFFRASAEDFKRTPGGPIAYWLSSKMRNIFNGTKKFSSIFSIKAGISTGKNEHFIFLWPEVSFGEIRANDHTQYKYTPHNKGGEFRKWMGNCDYVLKYSPDSIIEMENNPGFRHDGSEFYFLKHVGWSKITSWKSSFRFYKDGFTFDSAGLAIFSASKDYLDDGMGFLNSRPCAEILAMLNPTLNVTPQVLKSLPFINGNRHSRNIQESLVNVANLDWNSYESSWEFINTPLLEATTTHSSLATSYSQLRTHWQDMTDGMQRLEQENNRIFIEAYGLQDELTPDVPLEEITLTCNPHYRYGGNKTDEELEALLLQDTMREFCSYAVGCMFGRYSLDKPGLVLANQGEMLEDYLKQVPEPSFTPDDDNVIPMLNAEWFPDDVTERFRKFLRVTFGDEHYEENLAFVESGLNIKGKRNYSIRDFFFKEFYAYHVKLYKKRPIYWLFASPKGTFQALIYLHRYRPDTVSVVLGYLRDFRTKLETRKGQLERRANDADTSQGEATRLTKEIEKLGKQILELTDYERDVLHPLASQRLEIDLDDGVKANYPKFGAALKKVPGLEAKAD